MSARTHNLEQLSRTLTHILFFISCRKRRLEGDDDDGVEASAAPAHRAPSVSSAAPKTPTAHGHPEGEDPVQGGGAGLQQEGKRQEEGEEEM